MLGGFIDLNWSLFLVVWMQIDKIYSAYVNFELTLTWEAIVFD